jgi:hypothetical protein
VTPSIYSWFTKIRAHPPNLVFIRGLLLIPSFPACAQKDRKSLANVIVSSPETLVSGQITCKVPAGVRVMCGSLLAQFIAFDKTTIAYGVELISPHHFYGSAVEAIT